MLTNENVNFPLTQNKILLGDTSNRCSEKTFVEAGLETVSNKVTNFSSPTDTQYPSALLVNNSLNSINSTISTPVGVGAQYTTVQQAYTAGKRNILLISDVTETISFTISQKTIIYGIQNYTWTLTANIVGVASNVLTLKSITINLYNQYSSIFFDNCFINSYTDITGGTYFNTTFNNASGGGTRFVGQSYNLINSSFYNGSYIQFKNGAQVIASNCTFSNTFQNNDGQMNGQFSNCTFNSYFGIIGISCSAINCKFLAGVYAGNNARVSNSYALNANVNTAILANSYIDGNIAINGNFNKISNCYIGSTNGGSKTIIISATADKTVLIGNTTEAIISNLGTNTEMLVNNLF